MNSDRSYDEAGNRSRIERLRDHGVVVWSAERVFVGPEIPSGSIETGVQLMNAVVRGESTCIGKGSQIGAHGTATLSNVQVGRDVELDAGSYNDCVLLDRVRVRGYAEIRHGTIIEEAAELGHHVGLKNSFLGAWVVAGSLINFCDVFVSGGTSRSDHTEIGSGTIHFNFSPKRDKFASLLGDANGLLGRSKRIFIGGNSGLVAPLSIPYGYIVPAGTTLRDVPNETSFAHPNPFVRRCFSALQFIAALQATIAWYTEVRTPFADVYEYRLYAGAIAQLRAHLQWRRAKLDQYISRVRTTSGHTSNLNRYADKLSELSLVDPSLAPLPNLFWEEMRYLRASNSHQQALLALTSSAVDQAALWLSNIGGQLTQPAERTIEDYSRATSNDERG